MYIEITLFFGLRFKTKKNNSRIVVSSLYISLSLFCYVIKIRGTMKVIRNKSLISYSQVFNLQELALS